MYDYISGRLVTVDQDRVVIENEGIGFSIRPSQAAVSSLPDVEGEARLFVHLEVKEDDLSLYGFAHPQERELFRLILGVSRIGPKTALRILSSMREEEFREAVVNEEVQILTSIKGVGKKTARRLILELKDKIPEIEVADGAGVEGKSRVGLALQALTSDSLGFSRMEAREALSSVQGEDRDLEVQELIQRALKELS